MCNCKELPESIADPFYWGRRFQYLGVEKNSEYFQKIDSENWKPDMDLENSNIQCQNCGQYWYFEYAPEEGAFPLFGIKYSSLGKEPNDQYITENKEMLSLLAHDGVTDDKCRNKGCELNKLNGRELCVKHISFP